MSLINDMLRDLEARKRAAAHTPDPLAGVAPPPRHVPHPRRTVAKVLGLLVVLGGLLGAAGWYLLDASTRRATPAKGGQASPAPAVAPEAAPSAPREAPPEAAGRAPAAGKGGPRLLSLRLEPDGPPHHLRLVAEVQGRVPQVNAAPTEGGARIELRGTEPAAGLRLPEPEGALRALALARERDGLVVDARTARPVERIAVRLDPAAGGKAPHHLEVWLHLARARPEAAARADDTGAATSRPEPETGRPEAGERERRLRAGTEAAGAAPARPPGPAAEALETAPRMERRPRPPTPAQAAEAAYAQGLAAMRAGDLEGARRAFRRALEKVPGHPKAAEALARLELRAGDPRAAEATLRTALAVRPRTSSLARLLARLQAQRGAVEEAIATLRRALPGSDAALYGLLGALEQRAGRPAQAAQAYRAALAREPRRGEWWVGLGIALEHLGRHGEAADAYSRARRTRLKPALARFVEERLAALD